MRKPNDSDKPRKPRKQGFAQAGGLVAPRIRQIGHQRGFAETRLLTQWEAIVGPALAAIAQPQKVGYVNGAFGATLTILAKGAHAPELQMQLPMIRERVNACYGYNAISRVRITQIDRLAGLAETGPEWNHDRPLDQPPELDAETRLTLGLDNVKDEGLRAALEKLGKNVLTRPASAPKKGK